MQPTDAFPFRQIHLDFHNSPAISDIGRDFDAHAFAEAMRVAHVQSVNVFAKCHHGHLYYRTARSERHPGLAASCDLLREQVDALHDNGIRAPLYFSVQCDEYAAHIHPEWVACEPDGRPIAARSAWMAWVPVRPNAGPFGTGWRVLDMSSPYQDYLAEQLT